MSRKVIAEPHWWRFDRLRLPCVPHHYHRWLRDNHSLTKRVIDACQGEFRVRLRRQGWHRPLHSERRILHMGRTRVGLIREVELLCGGRPWVFARTVIPTASLKGAVGRLARLGERPLGAVLFSRPTTRRGQIEFARLLPGQVLYEAAVVHLDVRPEVLWGRRTVFDFAGKPLLVNEIFLPDTPQTPIGRNRDV